MHRARGFLLMAALSFVLLASAAGEASARATAKVPSPLLGAWGRTITAAQWKQAGIATEPTAHFSMLVSADGSVIVAEATDVRFTPLSGNRIRISHAYGCGKKTGVYQWSVTGKKLTLTKLQDSCTYGWALYAGVWTRQKM
jgi:hypothetical protein